MQNSSGNLQSVHLDSFIGPAQPHVAPEQAKRSALVLIQMLMFQQAWPYAALLNDSGTWIAMGQRALDVLDVEMGLQAFQMAGDISMVMALQPLVGTEEKALLAGHIAVTMGDFDTAQVGQLHVLPLGRTFLPDFLSPHRQEAFLKSSTPAVALDMRRDLMHWEQALRLAETLSKNDMPVVCREYAQQLELKGV